MESVLGLVVLSYSLIFPLRSLLVQDRRLTLYQDEAEKQDFLVSRL